MSEVVDQLPASANLALASSYYTLEARLIDMPAPDIELAPGSETVIICEREDIELAQALARQLRQSEITVSAISYKTLRVQTSALSEHKPRYLVLILPRYSTNPAADDVLRQSVMRLQSVLGSVNWQPEPTLMIVQFAGGQFGLKQSNAQLDQMGCRTLAASWYLSHPQSSVRVLDCAPEIEPYEFAELVVAELCHSDGFRALGYDIHGQYHQVTPVYVSAKVSQSPPSPFSVNSVMLVTGARNIVAMLHAAAIAQQKGVCLALVDQTPLAESNDHLAQIISQCQRSGLMVRYYATDFSQEPAILATLQEIQRDFAAPIEYVLHGQLLSAHQLQSQLSSGQIVREMGAKVLGAAFLTKHLSEVRWWLNVLNPAGLLGAANNHWVAMADELVDGLLGQYQAHHPNCQVISIALDGTLVSGMDTLTRTAAIPLSVRQVWLAPYTKSFPLWGTVANLPLLGELMNDEDYSLPKSEVEPWQDDNSSPSVMESDPSTSELSNAVDVPEVELEADFEPLSESFSQPSEILIPEHEPVLTFDVPAPAEIWSSPPLEFTPEPAFALADDVELTPEFMPEFMPEAAVVSEIVPEVKFPPSAELMSEVAEIPVTLTPSPVEAVSESAPEVMDIFVMEPEVETTIEWVPEEAKAPVTQSEIEAVSNPESAPEVMDIFVMEPEVETTVEWVPEEAEAPVTQSEMEAVSNPESVSEVAQIAMKEPLELSADNVIDLSDFKALVPKVCAQKVFNVSSAQENSSPSAYLTTHDYSQWQTRFTCDYVRALIPESENAQIRVISNQVHCTELLANQSQDIKVKLFMDFSETDMLIFYLEHWAQHAPHRYYKVAHGWVEVDYGVQCLERWLSTPLSGDILSKISHPTTL